MRIDFQHACVLHTRNYTDSRILVELFTLDYGRISVVARTARKSNRFSLLRPFQPLLVSWQGKGDLKSLVQLETGGPAFSIAGDWLYCGMYLNELLLRCLAVADSHPPLFSSYQQALAQLAAQQPMEPVLRAFELDLLAELGYGLAFDTEALSGDPITDTQHYHFDAELGFIPVASHEQISGAANVNLPGRTLLALAERDFSEPQTVSAAKRICRVALQPLLGDKPLKSRELFAPYKSVAPTPGRRS